MLSSGSDPRGAPVRRLPHHPTWLHTPVSAGIAGPAEPPAGGGSAPVRQRLHALSGPSAPTERMGPGRSICKTTLKPSHLVTCPALRITY